MWKKNAGQRKMKTKNNRLNVMQNIDWQNKINWAELAKTSYQQIYIVPPKGHQQREYCMFLGGTDKEIQPFQKGQAGPLIQYFGDYERAKLINNDMRLAESSFLQVQGSHLN